MEAAAVKKREMCVDESYEVQDGLGKLPYTAWGYLSLSDSKINILLPEVSFCNFLSCFQYWGVGMGKTCFFKMRFEHFENSFLNLETPTKLFFYFKTPDKKNFLNYFRFQTIFSFWNTKTNFHSQNDFYPFLIQKDCFHFQSQNNFSIFKFKTIFPFSALKCKQKLKKKKTINM